MTDAEQEWRRLGYGDQIDELKKTLNDPTLCRLYEARMLKPDELETFGDCVHFADQESQYNWFNYWPYNGGSGDDAEARKARINARTPEQCRSDILSGKLYEFLAALKYKDKLTEYPTVFQPKPRDEYDFKVKWGREYKCDCKSSFKQALAHVFKYKDGAAVYPVSEDFRCDFRRVFYDDETKLRLYLDGKLDLSVDDLRQIRLSLEEDIGCRPESKHWAAYGYASREEWHEANGESLEEYDRSIDARRTLFAKIEERLGFWIEPAVHPG